MGGGRGGGRGGPQARRASSSQGVWFSVGRRRATSSGAQGPCWWGALIFGAPSHFWGSLPTVPLPRAQQTRSLRTQPQPRGRQPSCLP